MAGPNPYTPGAGTRPQVLAGRETQPGLVRNLADLVEAGREPNPLIWAGLRGVGKTSLLNEAREELRERGWLAGYYEVRRDVEPGTAIRSIVQDSADLTRGGLRHALAQGTHRIGGMRLQLGPTGFGFEIDLTAQPAATDPHDELVAFLRRIGRDAAAAGVGVALLLDEIQVFRKRDLTVLIQALSAVRDEPVVLIGAGQPHLASEMAKSNTYAERFRYEVIGRLDGRDARDAVIGPALNQGTIWQDDALDRILELCDGYPYFLQLYASEAFTHAGDRAVITAADVRGAAPLVQRRLDAGLYPSHYDRLSEREAEYVGAMVALFGEEEGSASRVSSGDVARTLDRTQQQLATTRDRAIRKGIIHAPLVGRLEFSVPGFADYVRRRNGRAQS